MGPSMGARGLGGLMVGGALGLIAQHLGMPGWQVFTVVMLVGLGLPICVTGRFSGW